MLHDDVIREFLVESHENLSTLDQELVELEKHPKDAELLASIFRTVHTIKGTCGFFAFSNLERITHQAENLLSQLRAGQRNLNPALVSIILETVDAIRKILAAIEATGTEGPERFKDLTERLQQASQLTIGLESQPGPDPMPRPVVLADDQPAEEEASVKPVELESVRPVDHAKSTIAEANIRVGVTLLDKLMDLVGELVLARNQILQFNSEREDTVLNATAQRLN